MKVMVLGCGPAGLLAAHAASQAYGMGSVEVFSYGAKKSRLNGCQYLHKDIPGLDCGQPQDVHWDVWGNPADYAQKVYGPSYDVVHTSVDEYGTAADHQAWNLRRAYDQLWAIWGRRVHDIVPLNYRAIKQLVRKLEPDVVFSTIPRPALCAQDETKRGCLFTSQTVWAMGDAPELGQYAPYRPPPFTVVCNGGEAPRWYRSANVFDYVTCEWPWHPKPPVAGISSVNKPLRSTCMCHYEMPKPVVPLGRYGRWEKGVLTHHAYDEAWAWCKEAIARGTQGMIL